MAEETKPIMVDSVDLSEGKVKPILKNGRYANPWGYLHGSEKTLEKLKFFLGKSFANVPSSENELDQTLPIVKPDIPAFSTSPEVGVRHLWIGHATSVVQFDGLTIITDPMFSERKSPSQSFGPKRYRKPACSVEELPHIDCVVISHNHYDHLDYNSVCALNKKYGDSLCWYVPMGIKQWLNDCGVHTVVECTWWQEHSHVGHANNIKFVCTPAQHWSKRSINDTNKSLWCSWTVIGIKNRFFFAGDTGYCPVFKVIGINYGPFNLATIPIGAYTPRSFLAGVHTDPADAIKIHHDVKAITSIGIHWGTFHNIAKEFYLEPRDKLKELLVEQGMSSDVFVTTNHGDVVVIGEDDEL